MLPLLLVFLSACAVKPVTVRSGSPPDTRSGTIVVLLDRAVPGVSVMLDGETIVSGTRAQRIRIEDVRPGQRRVRVVSSSITLGDDLAYERIHGVRPGDTTRIEVKAPADSIVLRDTILLLTAIAVTLL
jgi:hypothetical protein